MSSALPAANAEGTYTVDGVSFSKKELEQCRSVMQTAISGIETNGTIDYINYAQMSIAATDLFANVNSSNCAAVNNKTETYKALMTPAYLTNGITNQYGTLSEVLNNNTAKLSTLSQVFF